MSKQEKKSEGYTSHTMQAYNGTLSSIVLHKKRYNSTRTHLKSSPVWKYGSVTLQDHYKTHRATRINSFCVTSRENSATTFSCSPAAPPKRLILHRKIFKKELTSIHPTTKKKQQRYSQRLYHNKLRFRMLCLLYFEIHFRTLEFDDD